MVLLILSSEPGLRSASAKLIRSNDTLGYPSIDRRELEDLDKDDEIQAANCYMRDVLLNGRDGVDELCPSTRWATSVYREFGRDAFKIGSECSYLPANSAYQPGQPDLPRSRTSRAAGTSRAWLVAQL